MTYEVREVPEDDIDAIVAVTREAFGFTGSEIDRERFLTYQRASHRLGAYDGGRLVSFARVKPYEQWFGGRPVPMGGVASVAVSASHQRRGVARATVGATIPLMRERGLVVSALYPTAVPLYRGLGWEQAGTYTWFDVPGTLLRDLGPAERVTLRPVTEADVPGVLAAYRALARETNGMLDRSGPFFDLEPAAMLDVDSFLVAEGEAGIEGYATADRKHSGHDVEVSAWDVVATTPEAERAVWFGLGAGSSTARTVRANAHPESLLLHLGEAAVSVHEQLIWMLRLVDAPAAVAARGWPDVSAAVDLDLVDDLVPDNSGRWRLAIDSGAGSLTRGGDGTVQLDARGLAVLYAGHADPRTLRRAGRLRSADERALDVLTAMTAGPKPRMLDYF